MWHKIYYASKFIKLNNKCYIIEVALKTLD